MSTTKVDTFDTTIHETIELLKAIEERFGWEEQREIAYNALRAVLHTLRDRLTVEEAADFSAQLPILIKGVFYEGWRPAKMPVKMDKEEFFEEVRHEFPLSMEHSTQELIRGVLSSLNKYIGKGEMKDVKNILPEKLANAL